MGIPQELDNFYRDKRQKDGRETRCKDCRKEYSHSARGKDVQKKYRNTEKRKESQKKYYLSDRGKEKIREYRNTDKGKEIARNYYHKCAERKEKNLIRGFVQYAIRHGKMKPAKECICYYCGNQASEYHHWHGYDKEHRIDVIPVCKPCHVAHDFPS